MEDALLVEDNNKISTHKIHENTDENVSLCQQVESYDVPYTIDDNTHENKSSEVSSHKQVQMSSIVYNTERRISSEDLKILDKR